MKRLLVALILSVMMSGTALAEGVTFGVKAGMVFASVSDVPEVIFEDHLDWDSSSRMGMAGGVYMNYPVTRYFSFQSELLFVMKGYEYKLFERVGVEGFDLKARINYIEIPLIARLTIPLEGAVKPWFCFGASIGFNMSNDIEGTFLAISGEEMDLSFDCSNVTKMIEFSILFGSGFEYALGSGALTFDIRYEFGLTKFIEGGEVPYVLEYEGGKEKNETMIDEQDSKNNAFIIMVGYTF